jgi:hypothetical protein
MVLSGAREDKDGYAEEGSDSTLEMRAGRMDSGTGWMR